MMWKSGVGVLFCVLLGSGSLLAEVQDHRQPVEPLAADYELPLDELRNFAEVFERIKQAYVHEVDDSTLLENAIRGMLSELDPHSAYLDPTSFQELRDTTQGAFGGLGVEVSAEDGYLKIISPIDDTPASRAGLQPGDLILRIDEISTRDITLNRAVELMRGEPGTPVRLQIQREQLAQPLELELVRDVIRIVSVRQRLLEPGLGYLRISQFQNTTGEEALDAINQLREAGEQPLQGLILDLRNNPGGVLEAAAEVADLFIDSGTLVSIEGRLPETRVRYEATSGDVMQGLPLIVLINGGSASASEIVAGALQDHQRAIILGSTSFGKGSVQTVLPLFNDRALKMTTALYFTPSGRSIQAEGIRPDIEVLNATLTPVIPARLTREADLQGHLQSGNEPETAVSPDPARQTVTDYPLYEAQNLLKGLVFFQRP